MSAARVYVKWVLKVEHSIRQETNWTFEIDMCQIERRKICRRQVGIR